MRLLLLVGLLVLLAGCGESSERDSAPADPPVAPPATPKPTLGGLEDGPPAAWLETEQGSVWLGYSTYCWGTICADFVAPSCGDTEHTPEIAVRRGETMTAHLGFEPTELGLSFPQASGPGVAGPEELEPTRTPSWRADREGAFALFARGRGGDASYVGCIRFE